MTFDDTTNAEDLRIHDNEAKEVPLEKWGPYLSERQWGTVREDYSQNGDAWNYFPHDHARSRVYRWGEDGLAGISDFNQQLCFAIALWNGKDKILKERLYGLTNYQGNHGEDVKELYYYLDNIPTHYYMKYLYKYPQQAFPYQEMNRKNGERTKSEPEYEILDTSVFNNDKYFDVVVEYAKKSSEDIQIRIEIINRGDEDAPITVLPTLWFYNRWQYESNKPKPVIEFEEDGWVRATHVPMGTYYLYYDKPDYQLFTENETNKERLFGTPNDVPHVKDAFHEAVINGTDLEELKLLTSGTKFSPVYKLLIKGKSSKIIKLRLSKGKVKNALDHKFHALFNRRKTEADEFYNNILPLHLSEDLKNIQRQAFAGLLWSKQYYHYDTQRWLTTSDGISPVVENRLHGRNSSWKYLKNQDVISMPDKWEYPWYAAWDLAFHCVPMAMIDPTFAKNQLILIMREWYMNPEGQIPAYEWNFSDVNPPVQAWAALEVYRIEKEKKGTGDLRFLKRVFQKLVINFTWWTNRVDVEGKNIFAGGFLGLDNIGVFDRNSKLNGELALEQVDGTSWMGMYALNMMDMALEIAMHDDAFEDSAVKFYEHFVLIADALNGMGLWNDEDKFFYDTLRLQKNHAYHLKVRSIVGLTSLFAVSIFSYHNLEKLRDFRKRATWLNQSREKNKQFLPIKDNNKTGKVLLSIVDKDKLTHLLNRVFDESEFLGEGGVRALSKAYEDKPYSVDIEGHTYTIQYDPAESTSDMFGGNSNWRGPIWIPINYMLIRAIRRYHEFYGDEFKLEFPKGSGKFINLKEAADELSLRLINIFKKDESGERPVNAGYNEFYQKPENRDLVLFYEYFHGDNSRGVGASHQTGWSSLVANLISDMGENAVQPISEIKLSEAE